MEEMVKYLLSTSKDAVVPARRALSTAAAGLKANVALPELRLRLSRCGYALTDERIVRDGRRQYVLMEARSGRAEYDERALCVGPVLLERKPRELMDYAAFRLRVACKALDGAQKGGDAETIDSLNREIRIWEDVQACL